MKTRKIIADIKEIREIYNEFFADKLEHTGDDKFERFLTFLEIDVHDWVKENLRQFEVSK